MVRSIFISAGINQTNQNLILKQVDTEIWKPANEHLSYMAISHLHCFLIRIIWKNV